MGGAIFNHQGTLTIQNSTLSGNTASGGSGAVNGQGLGGAIFNLNGPTTLDSATIASNTASQGGALYNLGYLAADAGAPVGHTYAAQATLTNSILSNTNGGSDVVSNSPATVSNGAANTAGAHIDESAHDLVQSTTQAGSGTSTGTPLTSDPQLGPLADNGGQTETRALSAGSPAVDVGDTTLATDQRGVTRPQGPADDIGAFELGQADPPTLMKAFSPSSVVAGQESTLSFTVANPNASTTLTSISFTDTMPTGIEVLTGGTSTNTCGGTVSLTQTTISVSGVTLGSNASCTISVTVLADGARTGSLSNTTSAPTSSESGSGTAASATLTVNPGADLRVAINAPTAVSFKASFNYAVTVTNAGPNDATNVVLTDTLPAGAGFQSASVPAGWACTFPRRNKGNTVTCTVSSMAANTSASLTLFVTVGSTKGPLIDTAHVSSGSPTDPDTSNNSATATTNVTK
jgi:uncharacterized repeat protein (TIGR01451 family)